MFKIYGYRYNFPVFGLISIEATEDTVLRVSFSDKFCFSKEEAEIPLIKEAFIQLSEYFLGIRKNFSLPISFSGSEFQNKIWRGLQVIPYGETRSYKEVGELVGILRGYRAIGKAVNRNPLAIIIPCHRVIGSNGRLIGYAGGLRIKQELIRLEQRKII